MEQTIPAILESNETSPTSPVVTEREMIRAATNSPALAPDQFQLGTRIFPVVDLPYDDYIQFISHLQPLIEALVNKVAQKRGVSIPGINLTSEAFSATGLMSLCSKSLPEMVCIMCKQTDPNMTVEEVKRLGRRPQFLAVAVMKQIKQNNIIREFADFFVQLMPMVKGDSALNQLMTEETHSS